VGQPVRATGLRRRLTIAFVLVAAVAAGSLALGSFLLVRQARLQESLDRAEAATRRNLALATDIPVSGGPTGLQGFVEPFEQVRGIPTLLVVDGARFASSPGLEALAIPRSLQAEVDRGQIGYARTSLAGRQVLVTGSQAPDPDADAELYFVFAEEALHRDLVELGTILLAGWGVVVVLAGLVGRAVAGRALRPVAEASTAARSIAEGLLHTRLPVSGEDEFGAWASSFNEMAEALEEKVQALTEAQARERRFTSDVAHELRTPLTAIVGEASLLRDYLEAMPPEARRPATMLVADVARLRRLVEDLMEISRFDAGREALRVEDVDLRSLVEAVVRTRGWTDRVAVEGSPLVVPTDRRRAERVVANLIGNGIEHGGGRVLVRVGREAGWATVAVTDRGPGIAPEHVPHLFDRFYKADPARAASGSGLGLAIAAEHARLLGGRVDVWSEVGTGSRFTLRLPVAEPLPGGEGAVADGADDGAQIDERRIR
jgi:two-component system sensor histidine kinase MtrB